MNLHEVLKNRANIELNTYIYLLLVNKIRKFELNFEKKLTKQKLYNIKENCTLLIELTIKKKWL